MKIELKNVLFAEYLSEETNAFTADLFVDGKKIGFCRNDGRGGNTMVNFYDLEDKEKFREVEEYCKTLPPLTYNWGGEEHSIDMNLEHLVDDLFENWLKQKEVKKLERKMKTHLMWGVPNTLSYKSVNYKRPLNDFPKEVLQQELNKWKEKFEDGEEYLNTNLVGYEL